MKPRLGNGLTTEEISEVVYGRRRTDRTLEQIREDSWRAVVAELTADWVQIPGGWRKVSA